MRGFSDGGRKIKGNRAGKKSRYFICYKLYSILCVAKKHLYLLRFFIGIYYLINKKSSELSIRYLK